MPRGLFKKGDGPVGEEPEAKLRGIKNGRDLLLDWSFLLGSFFLGQNNELLRNSLKDQSQKVIVRFI